MTAIRQQTPIPAAKAKWLTPPEVAGVLGIDVEKIHKWIAAGELLAVNLAERQGRRPRWKIDPVELSAFLRRRQSQPPTPRAVSRKKLPPDVPRYF